MIFMKLFSLMLISILLFFGSVNASYVSTFDVDEVVVGDVIVPQEIVLTWGPIEAASVDSNIFIASDAWQITHVEVAFTVTSTSGTLMLDKCTDTEAPGAGDDMLTGPISLAGTADTVTTGTLHGTVGNLQLADGDRLATDLAGDQTGLVGGILTIHMKRI